MTKPHLSPRAIVAHTRLAREVAAPVYLVRFGKPAGLLGETGKMALNHALRLANRVYRREAGLPRFGLIDPEAPVTAADLQLTVTRLSVACQAFEERYAHLTAEFAEDEDRQRSRAEWVQRLDAGQL